MDRSEWVRAATESMRIMTGGATGQSSGVLTGRITGAQTGAVLAFVSSGILGQYDPFATNGGELLLVYPNVIAVERQLRVAPADFRLWVCLHEVTHRVQFRANPWLADHMSRALAVITDDADQDVAAMMARLGEFVRNRRNGVAAEPNSEGVLGFMRAIQAEPQRKALDQLLVLGTLLEGHADHVMDAVGPAVVPSVATIRRRFNERRQRKQPPLQRVIRALLGFDAKISQYTRGKAFVDHVVTKVGMARVQHRVDQSRNPAAANGSRRAPAMDRPGSVATLRKAVADFARTHLPGEDRWCVALSGGADSLALTAVAAAERHTTALIVDHRLQADSGRVAARARQQALDVGCVDAQVLCVEVGSDGGPEAAARSARYAALDVARDGAPVLLAHTLDDQAETVLLGLGRGSGARSIAGMRAYDPPWGRPLLGVRRAVTHAGCAELGLTPWHDPHNADPRFTRVRLRREVLPLLEDVLGGGVAEALARTAAALREDTDTLDDQAAQALRRARLRAANLDAAALSFAARRRPTQSHPRLAARRRREPA